MKKRTILKNIYICLALFSTVLLVGCSKSDETPISDDPQPSGKGKITFNLHTPVAFLTKAVGVGDENGGTNDKIAFYQFSKEAKKGAVPLSPPFQAIPSLVLHRFVLHRQSSPFIPVPLHYPPATAPCCFPSSIGKF